MSNLALNLLVDAGLMSSAGKVTDVTKLSRSELTARLSQYVAARIQTSRAEIEGYKPNDKLNALFSSESARRSEFSILSSALVYDSVAVDDPLVTSSREMALDRIVLGLKFYSWAFQLVRAGLLLVLPISFFNRPESSVPLLVSDDAFRSCIPPAIHDFIHSKADVRSVKKSDEGDMLILSEDACVKKRSALHVSFEDDFWDAGVRLYLYQTIEKYERADGGNVLVEQVWDPDLTLDDDVFDIWSYQSINRAMRSRLINIHNETSLANSIGYTYVTESEFESTFLSMCGTDQDHQVEPSARFLNANRSFIHIDSPEVVVEIRDRYESAFNRFNCSLLDVAERLGGLDSKEFDEKAKRLFCSEILPQIEEMRKRTASLSRAGVKGGLSTLVGLSAAIVTGSSVPFASALMLGTAGALTEAFSEVSSRSDLTKKPAYIWHRLTKR